MINKRDEILKNARPILFNTDMIRAILDGRKTATRRLIKPQPKSRLSYLFAGYGFGKWSYPSKGAVEIWGADYQLPDDLTEKEKGMLWAPPCHTDDILYVRETWEHFDCCSCEGDEHGNCPKEPQKSVLDKYGCGCYMYRASDEIWGDAKWHPSIHMPKEAARIFLKVTNVQVERLQDITAEQARAEGCDGRCECPSSGTDGSLSFTTRDFSIEKFETVWDSTIKKSDLDRYGWYANPWVWVIEFERIDVKK